MKTSDAIDLLGYVIADVRQFTREGVTAEWTEHDLLKSIRKVLCELTDETPTDDDCRAILLA